MPHILVKLHSGRSDQQKALLAEEVTRAVMKALGASEDSVSVAIEDIDPKEWFTRVYDPDIAARPEILVKKPGYARR
jgi:4-oxalocrotonate tautomerase